jgi:hypothetical protein
MGKLDRLEETIHFGDHVIVVKEKPHKVTKQFLKLFTGLIVDGFKQKADDDSTVDFIEEIITEKPYEALKVFIPELTQEQFDDATNRELVHAFKITAKVNGLDLEKLSKKFSPLLSQAKNYMK